MGRINLRLKDEHYHAVVEYGLRNGYCKKVALERVLLFGLKVEEDRIRNRDKFNLNLLNAFMQDEFLPVHTIELTGNTALIFDGLLARIKHQNAKCGKVNGTIYKAHVGAYLLHAGLRIAEEFSHKLQQLRRQYSPSPEFYDDDRC